MKYTVFAVVEMTVELEDDGVLEIRDQVHEAVMGALPNELGLEEVLEWKAARS